VAKAQVWEARFLSDVYRLALLLWAASAALGLLGGWRVSLSLLLGGGLSLGLLRFQDWVIRAAFASGLRRFKARILIAWFLKLPVVGALLWLVLSRGWVAPLPFALAIALVPFAATLKAARAALRGEHGLAEGVGKR
jgi:hypothetical protein